VGKNQSQGPIYHPQEKSILHCEFLSYHKSWFHKTKEQMHHFCEVYAFKYATKSEKALRHCHFEIFPQNELQFFYKKISHITMP
jgi:hypothetical protein